MNKKTRVLYLMVIVMVLALGFASFSAIAKNEGNKNEKSNKNSQSQEKTKNNENQNANLKNFEKPNNEKGESNSKINKEKSEEVVKNLKEVADEEKNKGNKEVGEQIEQVIQEQEQTQEQTSDSIEEVETRGKVKTFLIGTDYKNLGQLRSELVHNRNQIRQLTQSLTQVQTEESKAMIEAQLQIMMQERERIKSVITANEDNFSLFGWVTRFLTNYEETPINEQEEDDLAEEVNEAIKNTEIPAPTTETPAQ